jgi:hypothetical protein
MLVVLLAVAGGCQDGAAPSDGGDDLAGSPDLGGAGDLAEPAGPVGFVTLSSTSMPAGVLANATFLPDGPAFVCPPQSFASCTFYPCHRPPPPDGGGGNPPNAGAIDVTGGLMPAHFTPLADGSYDPVHLSSTGWNGGESLTVTAAGGGVPAFAGSLVAPKLATVSAPALPSADFMVDRSKDLVFTFTGVASETVIVTFGANTSDPTEVECVFAGSAGTGTVPAAALALLPAGGGYFQVVSRARTELTAGSWNITFRADADAISPSGAPFNGGAQFQ